MGTRGPREFAGGLPTVRPNQSIVWLSRLNLEDGLTRRFSNGGCLSPWKFPIDVELAWFRMLPGSRMLDIFNARMWTSSALRDLI